MLSFCLAFIHLMFRRLVQDYFNIGLVSAGPQKHGNKRYYISHVCGAHLRSPKQITGHIEPMVFYYWLSVVEGGPKLNQH